MCYYVDQKSSRRDVKIRFNIAVNDTGNFYEGMFVRGFDHPNLPIITNNNSDFVTTDATWGLIPSWAKDDSFQKKKTLNARIESIHTKPSYKNITSNRCLIISTGFYEWRWLDVKGTKKEKYFISSQIDEIFCFAGLYDNWVNPLTGVNFKTFTMVTTAANELMRYVHNHKQRMPIILKREDELSWLDPSKNISDFALPYESKIIAFPTT
ncbi:SOS response-associated peptidase [Flavobacterium lipolyticum]|uniref:Abasic site processing protein n=1 Tax=Flavobacterium lipolyticum TaxID=2893754 RepID=A0ABS8LYA4_9FLAO|nr:SOS response-associated peptidase [Flavobacterium sp. F-126]MCC9016941.1 SOS response-associated peptidase [Flavobacterium sp. F-126]